jgi:GNAT superfamily N-acetyltransferase
MISLVDAQNLEAVIGLFEAQLQEHGITTSRDDLRVVAQTVIKDRRYGFMLVASAPDGNPIGVAYASSLLSLEHGGVSGWIEELYVLPPWRGRGIGSHLIGNGCACQGIGLASTRPGSGREPSTRDLAVCSASISTSFPEQILPSSLESLKSKTT